MFKKDVTKFYDSYMISFEWNRGVKLIIYIFY